MRPPNLRQRRFSFPFLTGFVTALILASLRSAAISSAADCSTAKRSSWSELPPHDLNDDGDQRRKQVLAVIGVQTGFTLDRSDPKYDYRLRRQALRDTWFPSSQAALDRLEASTGVIVRFVIGHSPNAAAEAEVAAEEEAHGGFLRLPLEESYLNLTNKTLTFFKTVVRQYDPQYIIKVDDDVYLRVDRVPAAVAQWRDEQRADYIGCMKTGPIYTTKNFRWYEPQHAVLGSQSYFTHCWGSIYVLSGRAAQMLASVEPSLLRFFANEDVTVGSWMLAMQVQHFDDRRLCETKCSATSLAVFDFPQCAGLCDAAKRLPELHAMKECHSSSNENGEVPMLPSIINFSVELPT